MITLVWLIVGLVLIVGEAVIPGLVAVFLGVAAVLVAGLRYVGLIDGLIASVFAWMGLSVGLTLSLRGFARRLLPAEISRGQINEQISALGALVDVLVDVREDETSGRIRYQGTTWPATSTVGIIPKGARARLIARENLAWIVEPLGALDEGLAEQNGDE